MVIPKQLMAVGHYHEFPSVVKTILPTSGKQIPIMTSMPITICIILLICYVIHRVDITVYGTTGMFYDNIT